MKTAGAKVCAKCGATISAPLPGRSCAACLIESGLGTVAELESDSPQRTHTPPMDFGDYELVEEIGRGGQGVVFRARQKSLNRTVALKVIGLGPWATEAHLKRFRREAEAAASLEHPRIVPIYDIGERDGSCYFSMKCVEGGQLDEIVRGEPLPIRDAVELIIKLACTVHFAHGRGILHRDIKPGNILIDAKGEPHLTDFGLARLVETESTVTGTMEVLGTPSYVAPEQAGGNSANLTKATDVYGLGAVLYQLLTGHPPFAGGTPYETIRLVLETEPRRPHLWNSKIDRDLETICLKCLEKDVERRYASALELAEDLERWQKHEPIHARRIGAFARGGKWVRRNPALSILIPVLVGLIATVAVIAWQNPPAHPPAGIAVLPFEDLSGNKDDIAFADGIQDDILTRLAKVAGLKVISRSSVMHYRGERNTRKIGQALNVSHVLEGSVRKSHGHVRLNAQLIDTRTDRHVWAEQYDRDLTDVFAIQSELAQMIATDLSANITRAEKAAIKATPTKDLAAYQFYVRAKQLLRSTRMPTVASDTAKIRDGISLLEKAVARDPEFAVAYSLLAQAYLDLYWQEPHAPIDRARAEKALVNARRLAPNIGESHFAQAYFYYYAERDYQRALGELETTMGLMPSNADVFTLAARLDRRLNRWADSTRHGNRAIELDPRESRNFSELVLTYRTIRRYQQADEVADRAIATFADAADSFWLEKSESALAAGDTTRAHKAMESSSISSVYLLFRLSLCERNYAEAERACALLAQDKEQSAFYPPSFWKATIARMQSDWEKGWPAYLSAHQFYETALRERGELAEPHSCLALLEAFYGSKEEALRHIHRAIELMPVSRDPLTGAEFQSTLAVIYAWIGERDRAIEQLALVIDLPAAASYGDLKLSPLWDPLRGDPRFDKLVAEAAKPIPF